MFLIFNNFVIGLLKQRYNLLWSFIAHSFCGVQLKYELNENYYKGFHEALVTRHPICKQSINIHICPNYDRSMINKQG